MSPVWDVDGADSRCRSLHHHAGPFFHNSFYVISWVFTEACQGAADRLYFSSEHLREYAAKRILIAELL